MFTVYHKVSTQRVRTFKREHFARRLAAKLNTEIGRDDYAYIEDDLYTRDIVTTKRVRNLMTGELTVIDSNTPPWLDPSTETYWSM